MKDSRCVAEHIKSDKVENVATGAVKIGGFGRGGKRQNLKSIVMDGVKNWITWKIGEFQTDEERKDQDEENCASESSKASHDAIVRNARHWQRTEKKDQRVLCIDDVTSKELP